MTTTEGLGETSEGETRPGGARLRLGNRVIRLVVLAAVFVCAACGLVYELALVALGTYLLGSSITQTSIVISVTLFAMGIGAMAAKPLTRRPVRAFVAVELALAVVGGLSVPVLYAAFAWLHLYTPAMVVVCLLIGGLVGAEIPLLMELMQRLRRQRASEAVADINAIDYVGALVGGLAFPFVLLPMAGLLDGMLLVAALNVVAAWVVGLALATRATRPGPRVALVTVATALTGVMLVTMAARADDFEVTARQALYRDPIVHAERSRYQSIVVTEGAIFGPESSDMRLFLDGDLQFSSIDEYRYHEMLVHPAMRGGHARVLVLGGGDGLALREVLRYDDVEEVTLVDLDPAVVDLARTYEPLRELTDDSFADPRVEHVAADAFTWAREHSSSAKGGARPDEYDVIIADFPDPDSTATAKLYSVEMYSLLRGLLADGGRLTVQSGSPFFAPDAFWCVDTTVASAGLHTVPYHASVPSFGEWGFVLAAEGATPELALPQERPEGLRFATDEVLAAAATFPPDRSRREVDVSTLLDPVILDYERRGWVGY